MDKTEKLHKIENVDKIEIIDKMDQSWTKLINSDLIDIIGQKW